MTFNLQQIADAMQARLEGDGSILIQGASEPGLATATDLAMATDEKYATDLASGSARAAVLWEGADWQELGLEGAIFVPRPRYALASLTRVFDPGPRIEAGIHPTAVIDPSAEIGDGAAIGPLVVIGAGAKIGRNVRLAPMVTVSENAVLGDDVLLHAKAHVGAGVRMGDRVIMQPGSAIGGDGFSFVTPEKSVVENVRENLGDRGEASGQSWTRIHSLGNVEIGDDVELGANSTIDRGTLRATRIGRGTKIDNLVQIGHNAQIGEDCLLCGQSGVAGSARIGNRVVIAGRVAVNDNITVGDDVVAAGGAMLFTKVPAGRVVLGNPATKMETQLEIQKAIRRLPRLVRQVAELQKAVSKNDQTD